MALFCDICLERIENDELAFDFDFPMLFADFNDKGNTVITAPTIETYTVCPFCLRAVAEMHEICFPMIYAEKRRRNDKN